MERDKTNLVTIRREDFDRFLRGQGIHFTDRDYVLLA